MSSREQYEADQQHEWERAAGVQLGRCERAEALVGRYRAALEQIAALGCIRLLEGEGRTDCSDSRWTCAQCLAAAALEEK